MKSFRVLVQVSDKMPMKGEEDKWLKIGETGGWMFDYETAPLDQVKRFITSMATEAIDEAMREVKHD